MSATPESIFSIIPRTEAAKAAAIAGYAEEAKAARDEFLEAGQRFATLVEQESHLLDEIMQTAIEMHAAKVRADQAVAAVKNLAGLI